jgi:ribosomal protein L37AE/L43A
MNSMDAFPNPDPLPCPFCGGLDLKVATAVWCMTCGASGPGAKWFPDSPKLAWNQRGPREGDSNAG